MSAAPSARAPRRLSALVVNYNTGVFAERCVASLRAEWLREGRSPEDLEVVVVDNNSPWDQSESLARLEASGLCVVRSAENLGYAGGMNLALAHSRGEPGDAVAILNPDLYFLPGSVAALLDALALPDVGAVDPRAYIDQERVLLLPRNPLPTLWEHTLSALALRNRWALRFYIRRRQREALEWWTTPGLLDAEMLSGCCVFLRRDVIARLGTLMDERFPLYFEDTDLFRRVKALGLRVVHHGGAEILHHWSRSAGVGAHFDGEPRRRQRIAESAYYDKYYGSLGRRYADWIRSFADRWGAAGAVHLHTMHDFGPVSEPPRIGWQGRRDYVVEFALMPNWMLAAGVIGSGDGWTMPASVWEWFFEGGYYLRALDRQSGELLGAWTFVKTTPGRHHPLADPGDGASEVPQPGSGIEGIPSGR